MIFGLITMPNFLFLLLFASVLLATLQFPVALLLPMCYLGPNLGWPATGAAAREASGPEAPVTRSDEKGRVSSRAVNGVPVSRLGGARRKISRKF